MMTFPPAWCLYRPKGVFQVIYDFLGAPLRMVLLPDEVCERLHLTSLRGERFAAVLPHLSGRVIDVGAGDNALVRLYRSCNKSPEAQNSVGVDVFDWGDGTEVIESSSALPYGESEFDTVTFIACLNHIPERQEALEEARRVLDADGRLIVTMIGRTLGKIGHAIWWYSEDKEREVDEHEEMGLDDREVRDLLKQAGFDLIQREKCVYGLNNVYIATPGNK